MSDDFYKYYDTFLDYLLEQEVAANSAPIGQNQAPQQTTQGTTQSPAGDSPAKKEEQQQKDPLAGMVGQTIKGATFKRTPTGFVFTLKGSSGVPASLKLEGTRVTLVDFAGNVFPLN